MRDSCLACMLMCLVVARGDGQTAESAADLMHRAKAALAQRDGKLSVPGLKEPVEVLRDRWGVPHIYAKNADDLFFAQGFVAAQDRLFQLDMWRRVTVGETAEIFGPDALEADRFARLIRYRGDMEAEWKSYSADTRQIATAFTNGINACIDHVGKKLPIEFQLLGLQPRKWRPEDVLGRMSGIIMTRNFNQEVARAMLIAAVGFEKARLLAPLDPPRTGAEVSGIDYTDFADVSLGKKILAGFQAASKPVPFRPSKTESNNWVVSGDRSVSGKPLLASDPHRTTALPSLRYLVHLNAPGWNVIGAGEPALPGVALGHNDHIAWGITIVGTDQADIHVLDTKPSDPTQYWNGNGWEKMTIVEEKIPMRASAKANGKGVEGAVLAAAQLSFSRHGPVIYQDEKRKKAFALKWAGSEPGGAAYLGGLAVARAHNKDEFLKALKAWHIPALNFVYADRTGTIGWVAAGLTPIRPGGNAGVVPAAGLPTYDWLGYLEVKDYPQRFNPPEGFLATANHKILPPGYKHGIAHEWAAPHRFQVIKNRLEAKPRFTLEDFQSIQHESTSLPGLVLVRLLKGIELPGPDLEKHAQLLRSWDGVLSRESAATALYAVWLQDMQTEFYKPHVPKELLDSVRTISGISVMLEALEKPSQAWFGDNPTSGRDRFVLKTFVTALAKVQLLLGADPKQWSWGKLHTATFRHPLATLGPAYEKAFNLGPVARSGDANTPNNTKHDDKFQQVHGASYRQLFDLADWDRGLATSTPGQSGQPGSPHYADLLPLWAEGQYFPLAFSRAKVEEVTRHRLRLEPAK